MINLSDIEKNSFLLFNDHKDKYFDRFKDIIGSVEYDDEYYEALKAAFFSRQNIANIQSMIRKYVFEKTEYNIVAQKEEHLYQIMEGIYNDHCRNLPYNFKQQIDELNQKVVAFVYPHIVKQIESLYKYRRDIEDPIGVMPLPVNTSVAGQRTLPAFR
jgi:hypothetical protein